MISVSIGETIEPSYDDTSEMNQEVLRNMSCKKERHIVVQGDKARLSKLSKCFLSW